MRELVGHFVLDKLIKLIGKYLVGLCADNGLTVLKNNSGHATDKLRKEVIKIFEGMITDYY